MWYEESVFYQIYPLGFCGAPFENDGKPEHRILKVLDWIPHMKKLGIKCMREQEEEIKSCTGKYSEDCVGCGFYNNKEK